MRVLFLSALLALGVACDPQTQPDRTPDREVASRHGDTLSWEELQTLASGSQISAVHDGYRAEGAVDAEGLWLDLLDLDGRPIGSVDIGADGAMTLDGVDDVQFVESAASAHARVDLECEPYVEDVYYYDLGDYVVIVIVIGYECTGVEIVF